MYKLLVLILLLSSVCYGIEPVTTAAAASAISPWALAGASALGAGVTSAFNWFSARKSEDFSERMANTAHQREVQDLRAAGLNPILSAGGKGAPSPSGNQAQAGNLDLLQSAMAFAQIEKTRSESRLINVEADKAQDEWQQIAGSVERAMAIRGDLIKRMNEGQISKYQRDQAEKQLMLLDAQIQDMQGKARSSSAQAYKDELTKKPFEWGKNLLDYLTPSAKNAWEKDLNPMRGR